MYSSNTQSSLNESERAAKKRRLESDIIMLQSDLARLQREDDAVEIDIRTLHKEILIRQQRLSEIKEQRDRLKNEIDTKNSELTHLRKQFNQL